MSQPPLSDKEIKEREERFRYADLNHPLMQILFRLQLPSKSTGESES